MRRAAVRVTRAEALPEGLASSPEESVVAAASSGWIPRVACGLQALACGERAVI